MTVRSGWAMMVIIIIFLFYSCVVLVHSIYFIFVAKFLFSTAPGSNSPALFKFKPDMTAKAAQREVYYYYLLSPVQNAHQRCISHAIRHLVPKPNECHEKCKCGVHVDVYFYSSICICYPSSIDINFSFFILLVKCFDLFSRHFLLLVCFTLQKKTKNNNNKNIHGKTGNDVITLRRKGKRKGNARCILVRNNMCFTSFNSIKWRHSTTSDERMARVSFFSALFRKIGHQSTYSLGQFSVSLFRAVG
eukprot:gene2080-1261_t